MKTELNEDELHQIRMALKLAREKFLADAEMFAEIEKAEEIPGALITKNGAKLMKVQFTRQAQDMQKLRDKLDNVEEEAA